MSDTQLREAPSSTDERATTQPYLIISTDDHAGPRPSVYLRDYCPPEFLREFDEFCEQQDRVAEQHDRMIAAARERIAAGTATVRDYSLDLHGLCRESPSHHDPHVRLRDMDADGVAAQVIFAGGQNDADLPWSGLAWNAGPVGSDARLRQAAYRMWNQWISEYITVAPERLLGVMQIPIWDIDAAVREVEWCAARGLRVVNLPAPRDDYPAYTDLAYEPFWAACASIGATLATHAGATTAYDGNLRRSDLLRASEMHWNGNRGLSQLIFGGVFERYPVLKFVLTEQRVDFAPMLIKHLDSIYDNIVAADQAPRDDLRGGILTQANILWNDNPKVISNDPSDPDPLPKRPSEYWRDHCYVSGSFPAPFEVALRHELGIGNLLFGVDYPHSEGTWPHTLLSLRHTFASIPVEDTRRILGENAVDVFHFDRAALRSIADRIGPTPEQISVPLDAASVPIGRNWAFRRDGNFS